MKVQLINITPDAETLIAHCARVSSSNQTNPNIIRLLSYCAKHGHWSIFEQASMTIEITTSLPIATQMLRHRSFCFQQFSQRYAEVQEFEPIYPRSQDLKNRQSSHDDLELEVLNWFRDTLDEIQGYSGSKYKEALKLGIAKESARFLLPQSTQTRMYMTGNIRNWIHYINVRTGKETQKEHRDIANAIQDIFIDELPCISEAVGWIK